MSAAHIEEFVQHAARPTRHHGPVEHRAASGIGYRAFVNAMSSAVTGVTVVTTAGAAGQYGLTVSAVSSVSAHPPLLLACINLRSTACSAVRVNKAFSVNILSTKQRHVAETFAGRPTAGAPYDFGSANWTTGASGAPLLDEAVSAFDCVLETAHRSGSHTIFIGRVIAVLHGGGKPLLYSDRAYGQPCLWDRALSGVQTA